MVVSTVALLLLLLLSLLPGSEAAPLPQNNQHKLSVESSAKTASRIQSTWIPVAPATKRSKVTSTWIPHPVRPQRRVRKIIRLRRILRRVLIPARSPRRGPHSLSPRPSSTPHPPHSASPTPLLIVPQPRLLSKHQSPFTMENLARFESGLVAIIDKLLSRVSSYIHVGPEVFTNHHAPPLSLASDKGNKKKTLAVPRMHRMQDNATLNDLPTSFPNAAHRFQLSLVVHNVEFSEALNDAIVKCFAEVSDTLPSNWGAYSKDRFAQHLVHVEYFSLVARENSNGFTASVDEAIRTGEMTRCVHQNMNGTFPDDANVLAARGAFLGGVGNAGTGAGVGSWIVGLVIGLAGLAGVVAVVVMSTHLPAEPDGSNEEEGDLSDVDPDVETEADADANDDANADGDADPQEDDELPAAVVGTTRRLSQWSPHHG